MTGVAALRERYDLVVVGAGPAGLAAATLAARHGVDTVLLDEQAAPGGQIYRAVTEAPLARRDLLGEDYRHGATLVEPFRQSGAQYVPDAAVWSINRAREIGLSVAGTARLVQARHVILATGALERPFPIPGWTLPGVMTAGAAQILLKSSGLVAEGRIVIAGTGPLLWLIAAQYLRAGATLAALLDTTARGNWAATLPHLLDFLASRLPTKALLLWREVTRRVPVVRGLTALAALGRDRVEVVGYRIGSGAEKRLPVDALLLHQGVVPNVNLAAATGCAHRWDATQLCFVPVVDDWCMSSVAGVAIAGDGAGIGGALAAEQRGRLAALDAAYRLGAIDRRARDRAAMPHRAALGKAVRGRRFLDRLHRPSDAFRVPAGDTIVCRCEEVTARQIGDAVALGCHEPNQLKSFLRCGMGSCQGRLCGLTVTELIARARNVTPGEVGYYRLRPPVKPLTLTELASLQHTAAGAEAVSL